MTPSLDGRLLAAIHELQDVFHEMNLNSVFIGGVAVSLLANPRATEDVDALIIFDVNDRHTLLTNLENRGFRLLVADRDDFIIQMRLITAIHEATGTVVDIMLGCMPFEEEVIARSNLSSDADIAISLPTPEDLVILKAIASRPKDLEDIRNLGLTYPMMDRVRIEYWVKSYAELMETPDLWERTLALLNSKT